MLSPTTVNADETAGEDDEANQEDEPPEETSEDEAVLHPPEEETTPAENPKTNEYEATIHLIDGSILIGRIVREQDDKIAVTIDGVGVGGEPLELIRSSVKTITPREPIESTAIPQESNETVQRAETLPEADTPPPPESHEPVLSSDTGRAVGFGFNFAFGYCEGITANITHDLWSHDKQKSFALEPPGFEVRLFPTDTFSVDFVFKIATVAWALDIEIGGNRNVGYFLMATYFHFHTEANRGIGKADTAVGIAPGLLFGGADEHGESLFGLVGGAFRFGADFTSRDRVFGFGAYVRPGFTIIDYPTYARTEKGGEIMVEFTWTWYVPRTTGT